MMRVAMPGTVVTMSNEETSALICFVSCRWMGEGGGTVLNFGQALKKVVCSFFCSLFAHFWTCTKDSVFKQNAQKRRESWALPQWIVALLGWILITTEAHLLSVIHCRCSSLVWMSMCSSFPCWLLERQSASGADDSFLFCSSLCK